MKEEEVRIVKKRVKKKDKLKDIRERDEEMGVIEKETVVEEIRDFDAVRECINEGDVDEKDVVSRVRLF